MFSDHGKQDNSRKNSLNNENLFFLLLEEEQTLRGVQDRSYKTCHFCEGHSLQKEKNLSRFQRGILSHSIFLHQIQDFWNRGWQAKSHISFKEVSMQIVQDDSKLLKRFHMIIYGHD